MIINKTGFKPDEIVMIGNDYEKDIKPAKLAGLHTIFYSKQVDQTRYEYADYITNDIGQLTILSEMEKMTGFNKSISRSNYRNCIQIRCGSLRNCTC